VCFLRTSTDIMASKDIQKEQTASEELMTMEELLAQEKPISVPQRGDVVEGTVIDLQHGEILVDVGAKAEGIIVSGEAREEREMVEGLNPGDKILVYVVSTENENGQIQLSLKKASLARKWMTLKKAADDGEVVQAKVLEHNRGGLIVEMQRIRGFIPFSHLSSGPARTATPQMVTDELNALIGRELPTVVIEADQKTNRLILSEKKAQQGVEREKKVALMSQFKVGQVVDGTVTKIMPFGLVVSLGQIEGLVHATEISWERQTDPTSNYQLGQVIPVKILELDEMSGKVNLSIKQLASDPWETEVSQFKPGREANGVVSKITSYGVLLSINGVDGLLRESQYDLKVGDEVTVYITDIDHASRRLEISLSRPS
jgi:small subunit ribosomal protein S1